MTDHSKKQIGVSLPHSVFSADWVRRNEAVAAAHFSLTLFDLMVRAGNAAFELARKQYPAARHWLILCGHGNNGGDGYIVASRALAAGLHVTLIACPGNRPLPSEAHQAQSQWLAAGGVIHQADIPWPQHVDLIIDGLLGIGLRAAPQGAYATLIDTANRHGAAKIALDIPSGLSADSGAAPGSVIRADHTLTFVTLKPGLLTGQARDWVGHLHCDDLGLAPWLAAQPVQIERLTAVHLPLWLKPRRPCAHKGEHGRLLLVGATKGLAGRFAWRGSRFAHWRGLVRVLTHIEHVAPILAARPELMVQELTDETLTQSMNWADVLVVGPGLGQSDWSRNALNLLQQSDKPALWDADALNLLALNPQRRQNRVLTPHPGEAARLLGCRVADIESDRLLSARNIVKQYGGVVVLKGAGTLIASEQGEMAIADVGNAGMASGGMGDILSGIIGSLIAQKLVLYDAACAGCVVHGIAADKLAEVQGTRGILATDLLPVIPKYVNPELAR
ncbi:bifunctional ADP-dependent NAD(P)H-hydrate dehydratase/NAD(P)H-hydrate epimerase [Yersinia hibernica]|uniref:Bifunctional NAD(P)H-hydrate repair enzyme n=1 Tax=Yersinia hibernica TaxID=2339259 RepID=A0ABX5QWQ7_9GAMM|nr:bifunctional ADP-dependent NAD(P)H-hydrate dehydratase/NAD(P)H-hydrate epimerase [Yersinia hibernica]QAX77461.1 bifunctional ADP-dependent NAD(P)H-hydrate dehydratase/NAD(P)H-hydrate epimerase [Yersinia hibernica]